MNPHKIGIYIFADVLKQNNHKIEVRPDPADATKGNNLLFEVRLLDEKVAEVELAFDHLAVLEAGHGQYTKCLRKGCNKGSRKIDFKGKAKGAENPDVLYDTYTVSAFDDRGNLLTKLDPIIIICDG